MPEAHEQVEHAEHIEHASHTNKKIALLIAVLALFLALSETLGKSAQVDALNMNIDASDKWNFFQAKTVRQTVLRTAAEAGEVFATSNGEIRESMRKLVDAWQKTVARYESDPKEMDGRKELRALAEELGHGRDTALARYHHYEVASAAFQIGIVLASASVITGMIALAWMAGGTGILGIIFAAIGLLAPHAVHVV